MRTGGEGMTRAKPGQKAREPAAREEVMYLGLDLGTSGVKALLIDESQTIIGSASAGLALSRPRSGWSEQSPAEWINALEESVARLRDAHGPEFSAVKGIGLSGQMHGATLLDDTDRPLRPCILWNDVRAHAEAQALDAQPLFRRVTGNVVFPGFTAPKLVWVKNNEPEIFRNVRKVLLPKDYARLWMSGEYVSDMSDSAGTGWLEVAKRAWSGELLAASGLDEGHMPRLVEGIAESGRLRPAVAARWGLPATTLIAGGAGDNAATACGMGAVRAGTAFVSLGTSGVLFAANATYLPNPDSAVHTFCHALPDAWHQMGVILSATDSLNWLAGIIGTTSEALAGELGDQLRAPGSVTFVPYLSGERTPHNDASIRAVFSGLSHQADRAALTQAVLEGVAFALRDNLLALNEAGTTLDRVMATGGGSRSRYWLKAIATALGIPVDVPADGDFGAAFGAARLALVAACRADPVAVCTQPAVTETIEPDEAHADSFAAAFERYRKLYPAMKGVAS